MALAPVGEQLLHLDAIAHRVRGGMAAQRVALAEVVRIVGVWPVQHRARRHDEPPHLGGGARVHHVQAADRVELVVELEIGRRIGAERRVQHRFDALALEDRRDARVGARVGEVDAVEAHALVETERAGDVDADEPQRGRARREAHRELAAQEGPQAENRDDARSARRHRRSPLRAARLRWCSFRSPSARCAKPPDGLRSPSARCAKLATRDTMRSDGCPARRRGDRGSALRGARGSGRPPRAAGAPLRRRSCARRVRRRAHAPRAPPRRTRGDPRGARARARRSRAQSGRVGRGAARSRHVRLGRAATTSRCSRRAHASTSGCA